MIIVDTSLWVDHLRSSDPRITSALNQGRVAGHPWVTGELALGGAYAEVVSLLRLLPRVVVASDDELHAFIEDASLAQTGIGWVDAQLLASARLTPGGQLATADRTLRTQAERLGVLATL